MAEPSYPAARAVAGNVHEHFKRHLEAAREQHGDGLAPLPDHAAIEAIVDAAFWASLRREEGRTPKISLAWLPPTFSEHSLLFQTHMPLRPAALTKVAPAVERPGIHLGIWRSEGELCVWGTTRVLPPYCFVVEVVTSGVVVVKDRSEPVGKFVNVALLEGDQIKFIDESRAMAPDCPSPVRALLGFNQRPEPGSMNVLVPLATSMQAHGRGGALLIVPATSSWEDSIVQPTPYAVRPPFHDLSAVVSRRPAPADVAEWHDELRRAIDLVAGLTAVDGATVMTEGYDVLAFGVKIRRRRDSTPVDRVIATEPVEGSATALVTPAQLGGTRHLSAAQFVNDQREAIALVASQDGRFTIFQWSEREQMVHAHRVEALLL